MSFKAFKHQKSVDIFFRQIRYIRHLPEYVAIMHQVFNSGSQIFRYDNSLFIYNYHFIDHIKQLILHTIIEQDDYLKEITILQTPALIYEVYENCSKREFVSTSDIKLEYPELCKLLP